MEKEILQKYTIFEVKRQLAEMEKQYGKERVAEMLGEGRATEIDRELKKPLPNDWNRIGTTFRRTNTATFGQGCEYRLNTYSASVAPNAMFRKTCFKQSSTI